MEGNKIILCYSSWVWIQLAFLVRQHDVSCAEELVLGTCGQSGNYTKSETVEVTIDGILTLTCATDAGQNGQRLTWYKNGVALHDVNDVLVNDNGRISLHYEQNDLGGACATSLTIKAFEKNDGGSYVCRQNISSGSIMQGKENGTILVTVADVPARVLPDPQCFTNITADDEVGDDDGVLLTCTADQSACPDGGQGSLRWFGPSTRQMESTNAGSLLSSNLTTNALNILTSTYTCLFSCANPSFPHRPRCKVRFATAWPELQTVRPGESATFTCRVELRGYSVTWLLRESPEERTTIPPEGNTRNTTLIVSYSEPGTKAVYCIIFRNDGSHLGEIDVLLEVSDSVSNAILTTTELPMASSAFVIVSHIYATCPPSQTYIIVIVGICMGFVDTLAIIIGCIAYRRRRRHRNQDSPATSGDIVHIYETRILRMEASD